MKLAHRAKRAIEFTGFRLFTVAVRALPHAGAMKVGAGVGRLAFALGLRRRVAVDNVSARLAPAGGRAAAVRIARESYVVAGRTFVHLLRGDLIRDDELWTLVPRAEIEALPCFRAAGGFLLVSGHFGNWEIFVLAVSRAGIPLAALAGDQSNSAVDGAVRALRARAGIRPLSTRSGLRETLEILRGGGCVCTLFDQDARHRGVFVDFLGAPASAHGGVAGLALRAGVPLVPGVMLDVGGRYRFILGPVWEPDPAASEEQNRRAGAVHLHRFLEEQVRLHPSNYFWAHRRWKTRPRPDGPEGAPP